MLDAALRAGERWGLQVAPHADCLNEAGFSETTLDAIGGRGIHVFHAEGAGGGHAPDILKVAARENVLPASTNPTLPYTVNTVAEHIAMPASAHDPDLASPNDEAFADSRIRSPPPSAGTRASSAGTRSASRWTSLPEPGSTSWKRPAPSPTKATPPRPGRSTPTWATEPS